MARLCHRAEVMKKAQWGRRVVNLFISKFKLQQTLSLASKPSYVIRVVYKFSSKLKPQQTLYYKWSAKMRHFKRNCNENN